MCLYPTLIKNRKYTKTKKNRGQVPRLHNNRIKWIPIGCQNCMECRKQKGREWQVRLTEEIKENPKAKFVGFTFSNEAIQHYIENETITKLEQKQVITQWGELMHEAEHKEIPIKDLKGYERDNQIATRAVRMFLERWRKKYGKSLKHWIVTELGHNGTENIHMHGIIWIGEHVKQKDGTLIHWTKEVQNIWDAGEHGKNGFILRGRMRNGKLINYVNNETISYMIKYVTKIDKRNKEYKSKILTSQGIGKNYTNTVNATKNKYQGDKTNEAYKTTTGHQIKIPIYWRNKIYTEEQREKLWIYKLDKEERWICGEKVSIKNGDEREYYKLQQWYRRINTELGYGGLANENRKAYEEARREILQETRIQNAKTNKSAAFK